VRAIIIGRLFPNWAGQVLERSIRVWKVGRQTEKLTPENVASIVNVNFLRT